MCTRISICCEDKGQKKLESAQWPPLEGKLRLSTSGLYELIRGIWDDARVSSVLSMCNKAPATLGPSGARVQMHAIGNNDNGDRDNDADNDNIIAIQGHTTQHDYGDCGLWVSRDDKHDMPAHPAQRGNTKSSDKRQWCQHFLPNLRADPLLHDTTMQICVGGACVPHRFLSMKVCT
jgi:hypothetical protein